jgi:hypothetical protein
VSVEIVPDSKFEAILVFEHAQDDPNTGDKKMIAFDPKAIIFLEQCWMVDTTVQDRIAKTEVVHVGFNVGNSVTVRAEFTALLEHWKLARGIDLTTSKAVDSIA